MSSRHIPRLSHAAKIVGLLSHRRAADLAEDDNCARTKPRPARLALLVAAAGVGLTSSAARMRFAAACCASHTDFDDGRVMESSESARSSVRFARTKRSGRAL